MAASSPGFPAVLVPETRRSARGVAPRVAWRAISARSARLPLRLSCFLDRSRLPAHAALAIDRILFPASQLLPSPSSPPPARTSQTAQAIAPGKPPALLYRGP